MTCNVRSIYRNWLRYNGDLTPCWQNKNTFAIISMGVKYELDPKFGIGKC